jgi:hypothetical protein
LVLVDYFEIVIASEAALDDMVTFSLSFDDYRPETKWNSRDLSIEKHRAEVASGFD